MAETKRVNLRVPMNLNIDGTIHKYPAGENDIPIEWADTDYVQALTHNPPEFQPKEGTPEWAEFKRRKEARRVLLDEVMAEEAAKQMRSPKRGR